ncbi:MAG: C40 family peptidase [Muribaculaceae bacterium]
MKRNLITIMLFAIAITANAQVEELLSNIKKEKAPDSRTAIWEIKSELKGDVYNINGKVDNANTKDAIIETLKKNNIKFADNITVLPVNMDKTWALVSLPIAHLRTNPDHSAELTSQALMGTPIRILEKDDYWYRVQTPDNYISWVTSGSISRITDAEFNQWRKDKRYIVTAKSSELISKPGMTNDIVSDLVLGDILIYKGFKDGILIKLATPDGREGYAKITDVKELSHWADQSFNPSLIEKTARNLMGSTYTWGGTSTKGVDCSGLSKTCYFANGIILQRDASQQTLYGTKLGAKEWEQAQKGDLLFFGSATGRVTHVAIYLSDGKYIHSSGRVKINSLKPLELDYLTTPFLSISRIAGNVDKKGIVSVKKHPWYFLSTQK